jgi:hypothetical protein
MLPESVDPQHIAALRIFNHRRKGVFQHNRSDSDVAARTRDVRSNPRERASSGHLWLGASLGQRVSPQSTIGPVLHGRFLHGNAAAGLLYSSPFLFFLCAFSIGAFRAFFEAISALSQIVPRLALVFRFFLSSRLAQAFSGPFPRF